MEEERRLFYVAMTRAREELVILSASGSGFGAEWERVCTPAIKDRMDRKRLATAKERGCRGLLWRVFYRGELKKGE